jgi:hypothetical protein
MKAMAVAPLVSGGIRAPIRDITAITADSAMAATVAVAIPAGVVMVAVAMGAGAAVMVVTDAGQAASNGAAAGRGVSTCDASTRSQSTAPRNNSPAIGTKGAS